MNSYKGAAYIFNKDDGGVDNWGEIKKITADDGANNDNFGYNVDIDGNYIIVSSHMDGGGNGAIFLKDEGGTDNWGQLKKIAGDAGVNDRFGWKFSIKNDHIAISANLRDDDGNNDVGAVCKKDEGGTDNWGQINKFTPTDIANGDRFGYFVLIDDNNNIIASSQNDDENSVNDSGSVYLFEYLQGEQIY